MLYDSVVFIDRVFEHGPESLSPFISLPFALVGAAMMLYGTGEWRRWAYLWVFLSIPISFLVLLIIPGSWPKGSGAIIAGVAAFGTYAGVRSYYARRDVAQRQKDDRAA